MNTPAPAPGAATAPAAPPPSAAPTAGSSAVGTPAPPAPTGPNLPGNPAPAPSFSVPASPPVPTAVPGQAALPPGASPPPFGQTLPAVPPASLLPVTPGVVPLALTADEAVVRVAEKNLGVLASLRDVVAARSGVKSAAALSPPIFTVGPALQTGGTTDGLLFEQPLELNGTRGARTDVARAQLRLTQAQAVVQLQALVYAARTNFYVLARAQERLRLAQTLRVVAEQFDTIARRQVALGARPGIEQRQTAVEAARARVLEQQAGGEEQAARANLNAYLGRAPLDPIVTSLSAPLISSGPAPDIAAAQRQALAARGEIVQAEAARDIPQAQARLSRAQGRPDLAPEFRISQITPMYMDAGLGVVITLPLDYGTRRNQIRQQEQTASAGQSRVIGTQAQVRSEAAQAASRLGAARLALGEYDAGLVENARAILDAALLGFREGATTIIAVLDAQRTYQAVVSERLDAQTQAALAQSEYDRAVGAVPPALLAQLRKDWGRP